MFDPAVCAEMVFRHLPIEERARRIAALGFAVELWDRTWHDVHAPARTGASFPSMTGHVRGGLVEESCRARPSCRSRWPGGWGDRG